MISGVRASSMRMLSTSSTIAKWWSRWKQRVEARRHVVAQVVEAELGVGPVGDVGGVGGVAAVAVVGEVVVLEDADADPERVVDRPHPLGVAAGEVVVDGDDVDAVAGERVEEDRERRGQRLALAGLHLGDRAGVQDHAADQLDVVVALAERPPARLAAERERLGQEVVERLAALADALAQLVGVLADLGVVEQLHLGLEAIDRLDPLLVLAELLRLAEPQRAIYEAPCHQAQSTERRSASGRFGGGGAPVASQASRLRIRAISRRVVVRLRRSSRWRLTWRRMSSGDLLDRVVHLLRALLGVQGRALQPQRRLGDVLLADRGVRLLAEDDLEAGVLGDLAADAVESLADALAVLVVYLESRPTISICTCVLSVAFPRRLILCPGRDSQVNSAAGVGDRDRPDDLRSGAPQGPRAGIERRSGRDDVVDEQDARRALPWISNRGGEASRRRGCRPAGAPAATAQQPACSEPGPGRERRAISQAGSNPRRRRRRGAAPTGTSTAPPGGSAIASAISSAAIRAAPGIRPDLRPPTRPVAGGT